MHLFPSRYSVRHLTAAAPHFQERLGKDGEGEGRDLFVFEQVAPACANLCRALGEDFTMFLPVVLPPLFAALETEIEFSMEAADPAEQGEVRKSTTILLPL